MRVRFPRRDLRKYRHRCEIAETGRSRCGGKIKRDRGDGTFDIDYDDGEFEMKVPESLIRLVGGGSSVGRSPARARIEVGSKVEGNYRGKGKWYPGKVKQVRSDGSVDIDYDDGEFESRVKDLTMPIEFSLENMSYFIDYNREGPFVVQRGEGECAV